MKERPIIFSAPMVRALLAGTKTQTRRAVKPQPDITGMRTQDGEGRSWGPKDVEYRTHDAEHYLSIPGACVGPMRCPYGSPGDRLWVRENGWERPERTPRMMLEGADTWAPYYYDADNEDVESLRAWGFKRRPSIHMPRWASRITLEVTGIRAERLQDIGDADAQAEGTPCWVCGGPLDGRSEDDCHCFHKQADARDYRYLWESINSAGSWDANPWVWVVEFRRAA